MSDRKTIAAVSVGVVVVLAVGLFLVIGRTVPKPAPEPQPPAPFRGISWGELIAKRFDMTLAYYQSDMVPVHLDSNQSVYIKNKHVQCYVRSGDKLSFGTEAVAGIEYETYDGKFYKVSIKDPNPFNLSAVFSQVYGPAKHERLGESWTWTWKADNGQTNIIMAYRPPSQLSIGTGFAQIVNVELEEQLNAVQKDEARKQLEKARKDF